MVCSGLHTEDPPVASALLEPPLLGATAGLIIPLCDAADDPLELDASAPLDLASQYAGRFSEHEHMEQSMSVWSASITIK
jgi:hypothetical protein